MITAPPDRGSVWVAHGFARGNFESIAREGSESCTDRGDEVLAQSGPSDHLAEYFPHLFFHRAAVFGGADAQPVLQPAVEMPDGDAGHGSAPRNASRASCATIPSQARPRPALARTNKADSRLSGHATTAPDHGQDHLVHGWVPLAEG